MQLNSWDLDRLVASCKWIENSIITESLGLHVGQEGDCWELSFVQCQWSTDYLELKLFWN